MIHWVKGAKPGKASVLSGNVNQRRYKKERKGMRRLEEHTIFFPVGRRVGLGCCTVKIRTKK